MYAILKNIHESVTIDLLEEYLQPFFQGNFFQRKGELRAIVIIQLNDKSGTFVERHALIRASSDEARQRLIKVLNRQTFFDELGTKQAVRAAEYRTRLIMNERRVSGFKGVMIERDHRICERRRLGLKIIHVAEKYFGEPAYIRRG